MYLLINPVNQLVVVSSLSPIVANEKEDSFETIEHVVLDPRPSSGVTVVEQDFPMESYCAYIMENGQPVRVTPYSDEEKAFVNAPILAEIFELETKQARAVREALLSEPGAVDRLRAFDGQIVSLRATLLK